MSRRIAALLGEPEKTVAKLLSQLEHKNGYPSHDARMLAENTQAIRRKITDLGMDPDDTTGEELYEALQTKLQRDSEVFDAHFGAKGLSFSGKSQKAAWLLVSLPLPKQWAVKNVIAKSLLRQHPPKKLMKHLGYRSVDSLLKREQLGEIFLGSRLLESATWHKNIDKAVNKLGQTDFELRNVKPQPLPYKRWASDQSGQPYVISEHSFAVVGVVPQPQLIKAPFLVHVLLLAEELCTYGNLKLTPALVQTGGMVMWWIDMDHLVAELGNEHISMSLKDNLLDHLNGNSFSERRLEHARKSLWKELVLR